FTGSVPTGKLIQKTVSDRPVLAKVCLELGGKNPLVVCDDADLTLAAEHAVASAFIDAGQRCAAGSRIVVFDRVYEAFRDAMVKRAAEVKVGSGPDDECCPVISTQSLERLEAAIAGAVARGARVLCGGRRIDALAPGYYLAPTILENVDPCDAVSQQELFGPVTCLYRAKHFDEAIDLSNSTSFGLTGAIHTFNSNRIEEFIARYRAGLVSINGPTYGAGPHMPFGGVNISTTLFNVIEGGNHVAMATTACLTALEFTNGFHAADPDVIVICGDRFEQLALAMAAAYLNKTIAHIEGGDVSGSIDESVRHAITKLAHMHFVTNEHARRRVLAMGEDPKYVFNTASLDVELA